MYTDQAQINQAMRRTSALAETIGQRRVAGGDAEFRLTHRMDRGLAYHALSLGEDPFRDAGYREDMVRRGCIVKVDPGSGKTVVSFAKGAGAPSVRTRFGRGRRIMAIT